jgi:hypothetical protein
MENGRLVDAACTLPDETLTLEPLDALFCRLAAPVEIKMGDVGEGHQARLEEPLQDGQIPLLQPFNRRACPPCFRHVLSF